MIKEDAWHHTIYDPIGAEDYDRRGAKVELSVYKGPDWPEMPSSGTHRIALKALAFAWMSSAEARTLAAQLLDAADRAEAVQRDRVREREARRAELAAPRPPRSKP